MARVGASLLAASVAAAVLLTPVPAYAATSPAPVTLGTVTPASGQVTLRWSNPADDDFAGVTVVQSEGTTAPATVDDGTPVYSGTATERTVTGLVNGTAYSFSIFSRNTAGDLSEPVSVTKTPVPALLTKLTAAVSPATVTYGGGVVINATLRRSDTGAAASGEYVDVYRKVYGQSGFTKVYRLRTTPTGHATYKSLALGKNTEWYVAHPATPFFDASKSPTLKSYVRPRLTFAVSKYVTAPNQYSRIDVTVAPNHAGQPVYLQQYVSNAWKNVAVRKLTPTSHARFDVATATLGPRTFRLVKSADADHVSATGAKFTITVARRTMVTGMSGSDVLAAQKRLAALRYDVGSVNGYYGYDTFHATAAFQKVNRIKVTGNIDPVTYDKLWRPVKPVLRYSHSGAWVEADLTKQVLYYARDGVVQRIMTISSGSGEYYYVEGETHRAVTPVGNFRFTHKIDGMRVSRLGELWRPSYFAAGGYAIHGSGSVPFHPASHGCIRITNPGANRMFSSFAIGIPVHVYYS